MKTSSLAVLLISVSWATAFAQTFHGKPIRIPNGSNVAVTGINDSGEMIANYTDAAGTSHCATISGSQILEVADPNAIGTGPGKGTSCWGINNAGQIVGSYSTEVFGNGFAYTGGVFVDIIVPGATAGTTAYGLNNIGNIVGSFADNVGQHGFAYAVPTGHYVTLDVPGSTVTIADSINDAGKISLTWLNSGGTTAGAVFQHGGYTVLTVPGMAQSEALAINSKGHIVFSGLDPQGVWHGFLYKNGSFTQFDFPGAAGTFGIGINASDVLVGGFLPAGNPSNQVGFEGVIR